MSYKEKLKQELKSLLTQFSQVEEGNRITVFNTIGLLSSVDLLLEQNEVKSTKEGTKDASNT